MLRYQPLHGFYMIICKHGRVFFIRFMIRILCMQKQAPPPPLWSGWNWGNVVVIVVEDYTVLN